MAPRMPLVLVILALAAAAQEPASRPANRLATEKSPYLRQHAANPVAWWPWCPEAFAEARRLGRPIFLSIGYSTCHWCHVMERESFEDEEAAAALNAAFVCIKLDREERPDIDAVYMRAVQALQGNGGWPATILLLPDRRPFWAATYLPKRSLLALIEQVSRLWREDRAGIEERAAKLLAILAEAEARTPAKELPDLVLEDRAVSDLVRAADEEHGGFRGAPKFPMAPTLLFLTRAAEERAPALAFATLRAIAHGGIHDHLGGGIHRYAVDAAWRLPHFEKMLYDQAQILQVAAELAVATGDPRARGFAEDVAAALLRDFLTPEGGFVAAFDADTEGVEGATYVWTLAEIEATLAGAELKVVRDRFDLRAEGNQDELAGLEGANVLVIAHPFAESAERLRMPAAEVMAHWRSARAKLLARRMTRPQPRRDDKIITAWNGLAIGALARAGSLLDRPDWIAAASRAADFVATRLRDEEGRLRRRFIAGEAAHPAVLEDAAYLAQGLLELFAATGDPRHLASALRAAEDLAACHDAKQGGFRDSLAQDDLVLAIGNGHDGALPAPNGVASLVLLRLFRLTGKERWRELADSALLSFSAAIEAEPASHPTFLRALALRLEEPLDAVLVGDPDRADTKALTALLRRRLGGDALVLALSPARAAPLGEVLELVAGLEAGPAGAPRVRLRRGGTTLAPISEFETLERALTSPGGEQE